ncbi:MAG TPA: phospholipase D-like domain-containing protein [Steroidobacteraceae bacterium]|nr:phospholipase D-like domain-containing protein [Steroidobacteraceae bacterium]
MNRPAGPDLLDQAFTRAAGASRVPGNRVRLLRDAAENYPAWLTAIDGARRQIRFENFIFCEDAIGAQFAQALIARARAGVRVRLVYDWLGCLGKASGRYWRALRAGGVEVRCFNPPHFARPIGWMQRDHRKLLAVDGEVGFITGLCIGRDWAGDPARGRAPWRDTGVEIRGPALVDMEAAFAQVWAISHPAAGAAERAAAAGAATADESAKPAEHAEQGEPTEHAGLAGHAEQGEPAARAEPAAGEVSLRVVATSPGMLSVLRLDQLLAAAARETLWLTDAYFAGIPPYIQTLRAAALDGVDVRLLVPGASDISLLRPLSQAGYRPLLESGVRVFEWKGPMLHAKTAVADGRWARVGSSNLNVASWVGNYELDALIEDEGFAQQMEQMYEADLGNATEIVLRSERRRLRAAVARLGSGHRRRRDDLMHRHERAERAGSASRAAAGALRLSRTVGAALTEQRVLAATEAKVVAVVAVIALGLAAVVTVWPRVAAVPVALLLLYVALVLVTRAAALRRARRRAGLPAMRVRRAAATMQPPVESLRQSAGPGKE